MVSNKSDFTQGNILHKLILFMLPILGALVLQAAYGAVDLFVVMVVFAAPVSTGVGVLLCVGFYVWWNRKLAKQAQL